MRDTIIEAATERALAELTSTAEFAEIPLEVPEKEQIRDTVNSTAKDLVRYGSIGNSGEINPVVLYALLEFEEKGLVDRTANAGSFDLTALGRERLRE